MGSVEWKRRWGKTLQELTTIVSYELPAAVVTDYDD